MLRVIPKQSTGDLWSARATVDAAIDQVLRGLTEPRLIASWAPINFEVEGLAGERLRAGSIERVSGNAAGIGTSFEVEVTRADRRALELVARGPVTFDVAYRFADGDDGVVVDVTVKLSRPRGLTAQLMGAAAAALMNAGALGVALRRLADSLSSCDRPASRELEPVLIAA